MICALVENFTTVFMSGRRLGLIFKFLSRVADNITLPLFPFPLKKHQILLGQYYSNLTKNQIKNNNTRTLAGLVCVCSFFAVDFQMNYSFWFVWVLIFSTLFWFNCARNDYFYVVKQQFVQGDFVQTNYLAVVGTSIIKNRKSGFLSLHPNQKSLTCFVKNLQG